MRRISVCLVEKLMKPSSTEKNIRNIQLFIFSLLWNIGILKKQFSSLKKSPCTRYHSLAVRELYYPIYSTVYLIKDILPFALFKIEHFNKITEIKIDLQ